MTTIREPTRVSREYDRHESHVAHIQDPQSPPMIAFCGYRGKRRGMPGEAERTGYCIVCAEMYGEPLRYGTGWWRPPTLGSAPISNSDAQRILELISVVLEHRDSEV
jgi:hypothetical protein